MDLVTVKKYKIVDLVWKVSYLVEGFVGAPWQDLGLGRVRGRCSSYLVDGGEARERRPRATWLML